MRVSFCKIFQLKASHKERNMWNLRETKKAYVCNIYIYIHIQIQGTHKIMMRFQKLTRNLFLTLHWHNVHRQQRQLSMFLIRYRQFASHVYCGASFKMAPQQEKAFCVLRFEVSRSVITVHETHAATPSWKLAPQPRSKREKRTACSTWETWTVASADGVGCAGVRWEINFLLTFESAQFFCVTLYTRICSKIEEFLFSGMRRRVAWRKFIEF